MVLRPGLGGGKINNRTHGWKAPSPKRGSDSLLISTHRREPSSRIASFKLCKTGLRPRPTVSHAMPLICQEKRGTSLSSRLDCRSSARRNKKAPRVDRDAFGIEIVVPCYGLVGPSSPPPPAAAAIPPAATTIPPIIRGAPAPPPAAPVVVGAAGVVAAGAASAVTVAGG